MLEKWQRPLPGIGTKSMKSWSRLRSTVCKKTTPQEINNKHKKSNSISKGKILASKSKDKEVQIELINYSLKKSRNKSLTTLYISLFKKIFKLNKHIKY